MAIGLKDIPFFKGLSEADLESVRSCLRERSFAKGQQLFHEGDPCERIFFVRSGRVKVYRTAGSGREQILETLNPGDTCACNPGETLWHCSSSAEAVEPATVWFISRAEYVRLVQSNSHLAHTLNRLFADRLQCFSSLIEEVSLKDSKKRLIKFLLELLDDSPASTGLKGMLSVPFTREELAQRLGIARETASRQLAQLKERKLIDIKPHQLIILDRKGLEKLLEA